MNIASFHVFIMSFVMLSRNVDDTFLAIMFCLNALQLSQINLRWPSWCQFHLRFKNAFFCMKVFLAAFLQLRFDFGKRTKALLYKKRARKMLMKLTTVLWHTSTYAKTKLCLLCHQSSDLSSVKHSAFLLSNYVTSFKEAHRIFSRISPTYNLKSKKSSKLSIIQ